MATFTRLATGKFGPAIFTALLLVIAGVAFVVWTRYSKYTALDAVPRGSVRVSGDLLDLAVATDGQLIGLRTESRETDVADFAVVSWDADGRQRYAFTVAPFKMRGMPLERSLSLVQTKIAPVGTRVAAIWRGKSGNYLSMSDGRGADTLVPVRRVEHLAISSDGFVLALSDGIITQVVRFSSIRPDTLYLVSSDAVPTAVSPRGRVALVGTDGRIELWDGGRQIRLYASDSAMVRSAAFLGEERLAAVGDFDGVRVLDASGSKTIPLAGGRAQLVAALDTNLVAWQRPEAWRYTVAEVQRRREWVTFGVPILAYLLAGAVAAPFLRARRKWAAAAMPAGPTRPPGQPEIPVPEPPPALVDACARGECVLFAGAGLSAAADYPTWKPFVASLVIWAAERKYLDPKFKESLLAALADGQTNSVAFSVVSTLGQSQKTAELQGFLEETFGGSKNGALPKVHRALGGAHFNGVMTTNLDSLLERTFAQPPRPVYTFKDGDELLTCLSQRSPFLLKLYGSLDQGSVLVAPAQYQAAVAADQPFMEFNQQLYVSRTLLFLGTSLQGISDFFDSVTVHKTENIHHYALVAVEEMGWELKAKVLEDRYGIHVLPFTATIDYPEVTSFVATLTRAIGEARERIGREVADMQRPAALRRVSLKNVGPFEDIDIDLDPHITVLLGDNGLGKSTILRAVGLALAGSDSESKRASNLIRFKPTRARTNNGDDSSNQVPDLSGQIVLVTMGGKSYTTLIGKRASEGAFIRFQPHAWQRGEGQLALGFPPLRSVSADAVTSPKVPEDKPRPLPSDILPIVGNAPDERVTDLKVWLVSMDYRRRVNKDDQRTQQMLNDFFSTVNELLEGLSVNFKGLEVEGGEIKVTTEDGDVPIHVLSQGTISMMGLIGILLPRLYDVYPQSPEPRKEFAIVLIDEIDAHMHPRWQQTLIEKLRALFPSVQFIVTTHSPFIAGGREKSEIVRLRREDETRQIVIAPTYADTKGTDVASLLTGYLFGLDTPVDPETERDIIEQRELQAAERLDRTQEDRLRELNLKLGGVLEAPTRDPQYNTYLRVLGEHDSALVAGRSPNTAETEQAKLAVARDVIAQVRSEASQP